MTLLEIIRKLNTNEKCLNFIAKIRWPSRVTCPRCEGQKVIRIYTRNKYECNKCNYQYNSIAGTIFSKTYIPLHKWMLAIYLYCSSNGKIRAAELARILSLPYKTCWHLLEKIRSNSKNFEFDQLAGLINQT